MVDLIATWQLPAWRKTLSKQSIHDRKYSIKSPQKIIEEATREELSACVELLAQSVVLHRAKFGIVTLHMSTEQLNSSPEQAEESGLFVEGKDVLEEALEIVRTIAAEPATTSEESGDETDEARTQFRISTSIPIKVVLPHDSQQVSARLENISWGGAAFAINEAVESGDMLRVMIPRPQGGSIAIKARVLRTWEHPDGSGQGVSVRFSSLNTRDEVKLEGILEHLVQSADEEGQRNHARLVQRLDIQFNGVHELQSTLDDISAGGLGITLPNPLQIGQSLQAVISTLDETCSLKLRARVVRQREMKGTRTECYRIGLKFEHPTEELKKRTQELIGKMATTRSH